MKVNFLRLLLIATLGIITNTGFTQMYRAAVTDALQHNGIDWTEKRLPPSVITFSNNSNQVKIKAAVASLFPEYQDSVAVINSADTMAEFTMTLDKEQAEQKVSTGKSFNTTGVLTINNITKSTTAQCVLEPRNNPSDGFRISVIIRFNPSDFGLLTTGNVDDSPIIVRVTNAYLNKQLNNF